MSINTDERQDRLDSLLSEYIDARREDVIYLINAGSYEYAQQILKCLQEIESADCNLYQFLIEYENDPYLYNDLEDDISNTIERGCNNIKSALDYLKSVVNEDWDKLIKEWAKLIKE